LISFISIPKVVHR